MEWGKAKSILIVAFLVLNMLLGSQLRDNSQNLTAQNMEMTEFSQEIRNIMMNKNIEINAVMPVVAEDMRQITVTFLDGERGAIKKSLTQPISTQFVANTNPFHAALEQQVADLEMTDYMFDEMLSTKEQWVYHQIFDGLPMFEANLVLWRDNDRVVSVQRDRVSIEPSEEQNLITSYAAVSTLIENYLQENSVIRHVQLGYHGQLYNSQKQFLSPFWRVMLADGKQYFVHAINGAVEAPYERETTE